MVLPIGIVIELTVIALFLLWRERIRGTVVFLLAAMLVLYVTSMPIVADFLLGSLERQYPAVALKDIPPGKCIVVLGGAVEPVLPPRVDIEMFDAADRVYKAAGLYRAGKGNLIIVAGGNQPWSVFEQSEAEAIKTLLVDWGVPGTAILLDDTSRNTRENAFYARMLLRDSECGRPVRLRYPGRRCLYPRHSKRFQSHLTDSKPSLNIRLQQGGETRMTSVLPISVDLSTTWS